MLPQSYKFSHGLCFNNFLQVQLIGNQRYQVPPFRYIIQYDVLSNLVRGWNLQGGMKYLMRSVKQAAEAVGIWTEENWDVKIVNSLYIMVSGRFNLKINNRFDPLSLVISCKGFVYKGGLYYLRTKQGTRAGLASVKEEEVKSPFPFGFSILLSYQGFTDLFK